MNKLIGSLLYADFRFIHGYYGEFAAFVTDDFGNDVQVNLNPSLRYFLRGADKATQLAYAH